MLLTGVHPVREALRARRRELGVLRLQEGLPAGLAEELAAAAAAAGVPVRRVPREEWKEEGEPRSRSQGCALEAGPLPELDLLALLALPRADRGVSTTGRCVVALDGVEDPQNLGAVARAADAAGATALLTPKRRSAPLSAAAVRASAGSLEHLPVARVTNLRQALASLQQAGFWVIGLEAEGAEDLYGLPDRVVRGDLVLVLGAEGHGIRSGVRAALDHRVRIPQAGQVASLNVAAAAAVALFELGRRRGRPAADA